MKQADSSLLFLLLMKALERCVSPRVYSIHSFSLLEKFSYMAILRHPFSEKFAQSHIDFCDILDILVWKVINSVDPQGNKSSHQGLRQQQRK